MFYTPFTDLTGVKLYLKEKKLQTLLSVSVLFVLLLSSSYGWAWNSSCHSPVQMAALMSRPTANLSGKEVLEKRISLLEKKIEKYEDDMDDVESALADSLNKTKLGDKPSSAASGIRNYIEQEQTGWPCASYSYLESPFNFLDFILPFAYAKETFGQGKVPDQAPVPPPVSVTTCTNGYTMDSNGDCIPTDKFNCLDKANEGWFWIDGQGCQKTQKKACEDNGGTWTTTKTGPGECKSKEDQCKESSTKIWKNGACIDDPKQLCLNKNTKGSDGWVYGPGPGDDYICSCSKHIFGEQCRDKTDNEACTAKGDNWTWNGTNCVCPESYVEEVKDSTSACRDKTRAERCQDRGGNLDSATNQCKCPANYKNHGGRCVPKTKEDTCLEQSGKSYVNEECVDCPDWKKHQAFGDDGNVSKSFCREYSSNQRECKRALTKLHRLADRKKTIEKKIEAYNDKLDNLDESDEPTTEASGLCFDCLKRVMHASRPTTNQNLGNVLSMFAGAGMSMIGYRTGQNAQANTNMLRIAQGYPVQQDYFALNGASAGFPYLANGLYGLTRTNTPTGGWSCTPAANPHSQVYQQSYGHGYVMPYY